jgi:hypothetical protein
MNRTALIETMARAMYEADEGPWGDALMKEMRRYATAALSALEAMAAIVPREATDEMVRKAAQAITDELMMQDGSLDGMITLPEDMELEFLDQNRVDMGAVARAALEAIAPAIRAEGRREGLEGPTDEPR